MSELQAAEARRASDTVALLIEELKQGGCAE
jgi:hypothetical protein